MMDGDSLIQAIKDGKASLGCPLPDGFKGHTQEDREAIRQAMVRIIEIERAMVISSIANDKESRDG